MAEKKFTPADLGSWLALAPVVLSLIEALMKLFQGIQNPTPKQKKQITALKAVKKAFQG